jgi:hypothetical protein
MDSSLVGIYKETAPSQPYKVDSVEKIHKDQEGRYTRYVRPDVNKTLHELLFIK